MTPQEIKDLRKKAGLTLKQVAELMGYKSLKSWQHFETPQGLSTHRPMPRHTKELYAIKINEIIKRGKNAH